MNVLLKIEWLKIKRNKAFWLLTGLFLISIFLVSLIVFLFTKRNASAINVFFATGPFDYPLIWQTVSYISSYLLILPAILITILVTQEFTNKTHRQHIIDGLSRWQFLQAKLYVIVALSVLFTVMVFICTLCFGITSKSSFSFKQIQNLVWFFLQVLSYSMLAFLGSVFIRKAGLVIGALILYAWVLEKTLASMFNFATYKQGYLLGNYFPLAASEKMIPLPFNFPDKELLGTPNIPIMLLFVLLYIGLYFFLLRNKFLKADL